MTRLGFLGVGWIGRQRMQALAGSGVADVAVVADVNRETAEDAAAAVGADTVDPGVLLEGGADVDGIVIATPSALHAEQAMTALAHGMAVFCQKPLGRSGPETSAIVDAARRADRLLGVDMSYRHLEGVRRMHEVITSGGVGDLYAAHLVFHNAYGPDKSWFTDPELSGGGCVIDLGTHLVDLALWLFGRPAVTDVSARLFAHGQPLGPDADVVEDHAMARLDLATGGSVTFTCSWFLPAGREAEISVELYGTDGAVALCNVDGSFVDFRAERRHGTSAEVLAAPPDAWGGRALVAWAEQLRDGGGFDPQVEEVVEVAQVLDRVYGR
jgi:predicted dehydrogenase